MRRRNVLKKDENRESTEGGVSTIARHFRQLDFYPKLEEDFRVKTSSGAYLSIITGIFMIILALNETWQYASPNLVDLIEVDGTIQERMKVDISISFLAITCSKVDLVAMDVAGEHQIHADSSYKMHKTRLTKNGDPIGDKMLIKLNAKAGVDPLPKYYCGSCYGAGDEGQCCNSCEELKSAYVGKGWSVAAIAGDKSEQCKREALLTGGASREGEGCLLEGSMTVNKVGGNFHVALGLTRTVNGRLVHAFNAKDLHHFNTSHRINHISFGEPFASQSNPLNGVVRVVDKHDSETGIYQYFIKLVPTVFVGTFRTQRSCQYSFTEKFVPIGDGQPDVVEDEEEGGADNGGNSLDHRRKDGHKHPSVVNALPGLFFIYDISPFQIRRTVAKLPFMEYFARLCAIVGGCYALSGVLDSVLSRLGGSRGAK